MTLRAHILRLIAYLHADRLARYVIAGGTGTAVNVGLLYLLTDRAHMWYLLAGVISFSSSVVVSFILQKFWTFQDRSRAGVHHQAVYYLMVAVANLGLNTLILYLLVDFGHIHYLLGQIIASGMVACESYVVYHYIFERRSGIIPA